MCVLCWVGRRGCGGMVLLSGVQAASGWKQWIKGRVMALLMGFFWKYSHAPQQCFPLKYINNVWHHEYIIISGRRRCLKHIKNLRKTKCFLSVALVRIKVKGWARESQDYKSKQMDLHCILTKPKWQLKNQDWIKKKENMSSAGKERISGSESFIEHW